MDCNYRREVETTNVAGYFDHFPDFHRVWELLAQFVVYLVLGDRFLVWVRARPRRLGLAFPWEL